MSLNQIQREMGLRNIGILSYLYQNVNVKNTSFYCLTDSYKMKLDYEKFYIKLI